MSSESKPAEAGPRPSWTKVTKRGYCVACEEIYSPVDCPWCVADRAALAATSEPPR